MILLIKGRPLGGEGVNVYVAYSSFDGLHVQQLNV